MTDSSDETLRQKCAWPDKQQLYLTLDFECDYGTALETNTYQALEYVDELVAMLEAFDVPLTCFVQTEVLHDHPEAVEALRAASVPVSFHPHSHTHAPRTETSVRQEIAESTDQYRSFFDEDPVGYRLPNGNVRPEDYQHLAEFDYEFDASVFPSWRPGHFDNTDQPTAPSYLPSFDIVEVPFTVYSDRIRIPTALSYFRLLGRPFTGLVNHRPPQTVVLNVMHDFVNPPRFDDLARPYQLIYRRNADGFGMFRRLLELFAQHDYSFDVLDSVNESIRRHAGE